MRKDNNIEQFDLLMKSILQDAEQKAPRSVWEAVDARLAGERPARKRILAPVWMPRLGYSLAFCAMLGAALFFSGTFRSEPSIDKDLQTIRVAQAVVNSGSESALSLVSEAPQPIPAVNRPQPKAVPQQAGAESLAAFVQNAPEQISADPVAAELPAEQSAAEESLSTTEQTAPSIRWEDVISSESSTRAARKSPSFRIGGSLANNDNVSGSRIWMGADGSDPDALTQTSNSAYSIPASLGLGVQYPVSNRFSVGSGLNVTFLKDYFNATLKGEAGDAAHSMTYVGVPINLYYSAIEAGSLSFYAFTGGEAEYCISNKYTFVGSSSSSRSTLKEDVKGLQFSLAAGVGVGFKLTESVKLYLDPSLHYYFESGHPDNVRTNHPLTFNFEAGIRFNL